MITVTLGEAKPQEKPFPKLMISALSPNTKDDLVLFLSEKCGVKLSGSGGTIIGEYSKDWWMEYFTDYNEPITIQNA